MIKKARSMLVGLVGLVMLLGIIFQVPNALAEVKPGDVIDKNTWEKVEGLVPDYALEMIKTGWLSLRIIEPMRYFPPSNGFIKATAKNVGKAKIGPSEELINYGGAGLPFPYVDPADPNAGSKCIWNLMLKYEGDDWSFKEGMADYIDRKGNMRSVGSGMRKLWYTGRTVVPPIPELTGEPEVLLRHMVYVNSPFELRGFGGLTVRYKDPKKVDDMWVYIPSMRRVRRMSLGIRSESYAGADYCWDEVNLYNTRPEYFTHKLLGKKEMLGMWCTKDHNRNQVLADIKGFCYSNVPAAKMSIYIVEEISRDSDYLTSKRIYYLDDRYWGVRWMEMYDLRGELWRGTIAPNAIDDAGYGSYVCQPVPIGEFIDIQREHGSSYRHKNMEYNKGPAPSFFSIGYLRKIAH